MLSALLDGAACAAYAALAALILFQARRGRTAILLAAGCLCTAAWAGAALIDLHRGVLRVGGAADQARAVAWYFVILRLYRSSGAGGSRVARAFTTAGAIFAAWAVAGLVLPMLPGGLSFAAAPLAFGLFISLAQLLLLENLYRASPADARWSLSLACIALGGLAAYDLVLMADAALLHRYSPALVAARPLVACMVVPLLALAAARNPRWQTDIHVSRSAVFYSATLVAGGVFLVSLAAVGEVLRRLSPVGGGGWGGLAQVALLFAGLLCVAVLLTSGRGRSWLRGLLVDHFFTHRYDYRREWLRCIGTLSGRTEPAPLEQRAIRALAQLVDSPSGVLLSREGADASLEWAGCWGLPPSLLSLPATHPAVARLASAQDALMVPSTGPLALKLAETPAAPRAWLAVPLQSPAGLAGCVLLAHPRAPFTLDAEVFDLLRTAASEVATYLAEQRAARVLHQTQDLRAYGQRFAFVAHDIKNVASQLTLMLRNAETHLANPEFQQDMLTTVRASLARIGSLLRKLEAPEPGAGAGTLCARTRIATLAATIGTAHAAPVQLQADTSTHIVAIDPSAFDAVVTHLLTNAVEAAPPGSPLTLGIRADGERVLIDITDRGRGMSAAFVRDELFRPLATSKPGGSGIGAYQARELLRAAGGSLTVASTEGSGTTMRITLPRAGAHAMVAA